MIMRQMHAKLELKPQGGVLLRDVAGRTVTCVSGRVWLTMEHDTRDVTLGARDSFVVDRTGLTIVAAHEASTIELSPQPARRGRWARCLDFINQVWRPAAIRAARPWEHY